jgi:hypothetical protein
LKEFFLVEDDNVDMFSAKCPKIPLSEDVLVEIQQKNATKKVKKILKNIHY